MSGDSMKVKQKVSKSELHRHFDLKKSMFYPTIASFFQTQLKIGLLFLYAIE